MTLRGSFLTSIHGATCFETGRKRFQRAEGESKEREREEERGRASRWSQLHDHHQPRTLSQSLLSRSDPYKCNHDVAGDEASMRMRARELTPRWLIVCIFELLTRGPKIQSRINVDTTGTPADIFAGEMHRLPATDYPCRSPLRMHARGRGAPAIKGGRGPVFDPPWRTGTTYRNGLIPAPSIREMFHLGFKGFLLLIIDPGTCSILCFKLDFPSVLQTCD